LISTLIDPESTLVSDFFVDDNPEDWIQASMTLSQPLDVPL
jgi:hypothetical protein